MYKIVRKKELNDSVTLMDIEAPFIAKKAKAGQIIIFRIDEKGERVPVPWPPLPSFCPTRTACSGS